MDLNDYAIKFPNIDYSSKIIDEELYNILSNLNIKTILEVGSGNGALAFHILNKFNHIQEYHCVEPSSIRANIISQELIEFNNKLFVHIGYLEDLVIGTNFDLIISEQVIEHVDDDFHFISSLIDIGATNTIFYISTVYKNSFSWYFYRNKFGEYVLDPTHVREYKASSLNSLTEFISTLAIIKQISFRSILYPISGLLKRFKFFGAYLNNFLYRVKIRIPGYYNLLIIFVKK